MDIGPQQLSRMKTWVGCARCLDDPRSSPKDQEGRFTKKLVLEFAIRLHSHNKEDHTNLPTTEHQQVYSHLEMGGQKPSDAI